MAKKIAFTARGVAATVLPEVNCRVVVLAEDPDGDGGPRLEIQRALTHSEWDREFGEVTYCLCTQAGQCVYGGVRSYTLDDAILTMRLDARARDTLGIPGEFSIRLETDAATIEEVRSALTWILREGTD